MPVDEQPDGGGEVRRADPVDEPADAGRVAPPDGEVEDLLGDLLEAVEEGRAAGQDDPGVEGFLVAHPLDVVVHEPEDLLGPRLDDVGQELAGEDPRLAARCRPRGPRSSPGPRPAGAETQPNLFLIFSASGMAVRSPTAMSLVKLSPPRGMFWVYHRLPALEDGHLGRPGADVDEPDAELLLVVGQDGGARGDLVEDDLLDVDPGPLDAGPEVLAEGDGAGDDVDVDLELDAVHPAADRGCRPARPRRTPGG